MLAKSTSAIPRKAEYAREPFASVSASPAVLPRMSGAGVRRAADGRQEITPVIALSLRPAP